MVDGPYRQSVKMTVSTVQTVEGTIHRITVKTHRQVLFCCKKFESWSKILLSSMQRACRGKEHAEAKSIDFALTFSPTEKNLTRTEEEHCHAQQKEISTVAHAKKTNYLCPHFNTRRKLCCCVQVLPKHHYDHVVRVKCFNPLTAQQKEMSNCVQSSVVWAWF
jgi:hypothetical protein